MKNWIPGETYLKGETVELLPLEHSHFPELMKLATDKRIWEFYVFDGSDPEKFAAALDLALVEQKNATQFPFVIFHKASEKLIGSTRFMDIHPLHRKLEIGWTWLHPDYWGTAINLESKLLLLTFCFETIGAVRVQLKTDENNIRSRKAIEKIGGKFEGILRNDMIRDNGTNRNSAYFSITDAEWMEVKDQLTKLYQGKKKAKG